MNCKPGDLAIVVRSESGRNLGKIVEVIKPMGEVPDFNGYFWCVGAGHTWLVEAKGAPLSVKYGAPLHVLPVPDSHLRPISGVPLNDEITDELEVLA